jgi:hypothetical protein
MTREPIAAWTRPSSRGTVQYEITLWSDGTHSCDCPGWVYARKGQERICKHVRELSREMMDELERYQAKRRPPGAPIAVVRDQPPRAAEVNPWDDDPPARPADRPPARPRRAADAPKPPVPRPSRRIRLTDD